MNILVQTADQFSCVFLLQSLEIFWKFEKQIWAVESKKSC